MRISKKILEICRINPAENSKNILESIDENESNNQAYKPIFEFFLVFRIVATSDSPCHTKCRSSEHSEQKRNLDNPIYNSLNQFCKRWNFTDIESILRFLCTNLFLLDKILCLLPFFLFTNTLTFCSERLF